jgi:RND family efflux transporter MFP subunit
MPFLPSPLSSSGLRRRRLVAVALVAGAALAGLPAACNRPPAAPSDQASQEAPAGPPAVKVVHPERKDVRRLIERPGYNIEAYERTLLYAKIAGYVQKWNVDMGDRVHKGDVLAKLYVPELEVEVKQKDASVRQAQAEIDQAKAAVLRAQAELERAQAQYVRLDRLSAVLDKDQREEYRLGFEAAKAALAKAQADVSVAEARLDVAKADRDHAQTLLQYTKIPAPFDGVVTGRRSINTGDFVQPADASKGEALFVVEKVDPVRVFVNVQELEAVWVRDGDVALIRGQSLRGQQFKGRVTRLSGSLNPENRTLRTQIDLPNAEGRLKPGLYVTVTIVAEHKNVWSLPATAVVTRGEQAFCYRMENSKAVRTPIQVGLRGNEKSDGWVEVLKKQMKPAVAGEEARWEDWSGAEAIVASDPSSLTDGQALTPAAKP